MDTRRLRPWNPNHPARWSEAHFRSWLHALSPEERRHLIYDWRSWARPAQLAPEGDWRVWLILAGRGWGKSRCGAEWVIERARRGCRRIALVGQTAADVRDVMIRGESGILTISAPEFRPLYEPSKRLLTWPNGCEAHTYSGDEPDQLRGPAHDSAWADEPAKWRYLVSAWDNLEMGLRSGADPQVVATTSPRPLPLIKQFIADAKTESPTCVVTTGITYENAPNLAPSFLKRLREKYEGTRLGRQELHAQILDDNPDALWNRTLLDDLRVTKAPDLKRIVVAVDPQAGEDGSETGIVAAGLGADGHGYVLGDYSLRASPDAWGKQAVAAYNNHRADRLVAEINQGGKMVEHVIRTVDKSVSYRGVHAKRGKYLRAEPVAALFEQKRVHLVGNFAALEDQMCEWVPGDESPDRLDALCYAIQELMLDSKPQTNFGW